VDRLGAQRVDCADFNVEETRRMVRNAEQRELVAVVVTADGRRVPVRYGQTTRPESLLAVLRLLVLGLVGLITGSRRETGGRR